MENDHEAYAAMINNIAEEGRNVKPGTCGVVTFVAKSLTSVDTAVKEVLKGLQNDWLRRHYKILDAYYKATSRTATVVSNLEKHITSAATQLWKLHTLTEDGILTDEAALKELMNVNTRDLHLPMSIVTDLDEVRNMYVEVIKMCDKHVTDDIKEAEEEVRRKNSIFGVLIGLTAVAALCVPVLGIAAGVGLLSTTEAVLAGGMALVVSSSAAIAAAVNTVSAVAKNLVEQGKLIYEIRTKSHYISVNIQKLRVFTDSVLNQLNQTDEKVELLQKLKIVEKLKEPSFRDDVKRELEDLRKLEAQCRQLVKTVMEALDYFMERCADVVVRPVIKAKELEE